MAGDSKIQFSRPAHSPALSRAARRAGGVYYTPPELVDLVVELTMPAEWRSDDCSGERRILDPACGAGAFLTGAARWLDARGLTATLHGVDIDPGAIRAAAERLQSRRSTVWLGVGDALTSPFIAQNLLASFQGSNTASRRDTDSNGTLIFRSRSERTTGGEAFDVIVGNPPYLSIRELAKSLGSEAVEQLRGRYQTARGNFDLYVLFIERALELLKPGGRCGLVIPNKWATLDYARPCRELLLTQATIEDVVDLAGCKAFAQANVYPHVLVFQKRSPSQAHRVRVSDYARERSSVALWSASSTDETRRHEGHEEEGTASSCSSSLGVFETNYEAARWIPQKQLRADAFYFGEDLEIEGRVVTRTLGEVATIGCGTAGFAAQRIAGRLIDCSPALPCSPAAHRPFITSGSIQRYGIRPEGVRYLGVTYESARLPEDCPELTDAKRHLIAAPKIVVAGMSRRLEAAIDMRGRALGVQVFAVYRSEVDLHYLLALLNSKLLSYLFATRFAGKRLGGGYLSVNKGQLARLPVVIPRERGDKRRLQRLSQLARWAGTNCLAVNDAIDQLVYKLYRLTSTEVSRVEAHFSSASTRQKQVA